VVGPGIPAAASNELEGLAGLAELAGPTPVGPVLQPAASTSAAAVIATKARRGRTLPV
jgi:hypothetical protein